MIRGDVETINHQEIQNRHMVWICTLYTPIFQIHKANKVHLCILQILFHYHHQLVR